MRIVHKEHYMYMQGLHYDLDSLFPENPDYLQDEEFCLKDHDYIKDLYPSWLRSITDIVEEYVDRYEYDGSIIYHEYPDKSTIYSMVEDIYYMLGYNKDDVSDIVLDIIQFILCNEMYIRRRRHDTISKQFCFKSNTK